MKLYIGKPYIGEGSNRDKARLNFPLMYSDLVRGGGYTNYIMK